MSQRQFFYAKIHRATVTQTNPDYDGSITIDDQLLTAASIKPFERVQVVNVDTGARLDTYTLEGDSGVIELNGAAAHRAKVGDTIIIIAYTLTPANNRPVPTIVHVTDTNEIETIRRHTL